ncbi:E3 ubiquitin-protein ligase TRIM69-like [Rhinoraja longicauda]
MGSTGSSAILRPSCKYTEIEKESKLHCGEHQEELKLFCETDKKLICVVCAAGREHKSHSFALIAEAAEFYKDQVNVSIQSLTKKKSEIMRMEQQQKQKISEVLEQSHNLQSKVTSQFAELHQILTEKEQRVQSDIREEEKKILNAMEKNLREIEENLNSIQEELCKLQQQMDQKDSVVFLKGEAGHKRRVRDEAKPLSVVDDALPIEKFHCPVSLNTAFKETSDDFKQGLVPCKDLSIWVSAWVCQCARLRWSAEDMESSVERFGRSLEARWDNSVVQRGVEDVSEDMCQLISTFPEHPAWAVESSYSLRWFGFPATCAWCSWGHEGNSGFPDHGHALLA